MKAIVLSLLMATTATTAHLDPRATLALQSVAGPGVRIDCNLKRPEALGHAYPARRVIGVRPWVCKRVNDALLDEPVPSSAASDRTAFALLVLTHEAVHLSDYAGAFDEALTECRAVQLVRDVALALGASDEAASAYGHEALKYDAQLPGYGDYRVGLGMMPNYHAAGCFDGGGLDIHPDSTDWPN